MVVQLTFNFEVQLLGSIYQRNGKATAIGLVASLVLVTPGLDCPGMSLAEVCATCLRGHLW